MSCEGWVAIVNKTIGYCMLDTNDIIFMSWLKVNNDHFKLPVEKTWLSVKNVASPVEKYFICTEETCIKARLAVNFDSMEFFNLLKTHADLIMPLMELSCKIAKMWCDDLMFAMGDLTEAIISISKIFLKEKISFTILKSVHECKGKDSPLDDFPYWSFLVQDIHNKVIFGYLSRLIIPGQLCLSDSYHRFVILIGNSCCIDISKFDNTYVLVKNYKLITEMFREVVPIRYEYIYVDLKDIVIISTNNVPSYFLPESTLPPANIQLHKYMIKFLIRKKSSVLLLENAKETEFYLEVEITHSSNYIPTGAIVYFIILNPYINLNTHLKENKRYALYYTDIYLAYNGLLENIERRTTYCLQGSNAYFHELKTPKGYLKNIITVRKCQNFLISEKRMLSFQGIISEITFSYKFAEAQDINRLRGGFGTVGNDTLCLTFKMSVGAEINKLQLYLSHWNNKATPFGLVPQMRVLVKNVIPEDDYLKSTIFTTIEIICLEKKVERNFVIQEIKDVEKDDENNIESEN